jgi:hypothetical protein
MRIFGCIPSKILELGPAASMSVWLHKQAM